MDLRTLRPTFVSKESEKLLGFSAEEWTKPGFWQERLLPEDLVRTAAFMRAAADGGPVQEIDYRILTEDGRRIWLRTLVRLLPRPGQDAELVGVTFDQSFRRRADALIAGDLKILELVASGMPVLEILRELALVIEEQADGVIASIFLLEDGRTIRHAAGPHLPPLSRRRWTERRSAPTAAPAEPPPTGARA